MGPLSPPRMSAGWRPHCRFGCGGDSPQSRKVPSQCCAPRARERDLPPRPGIHPHTGDLHVPGFSERREVLAQCRIRDLQAFAYVGERQGPDGREHRAYLQTQGRVNQLVERRAAHSCHA